MWITTFYLPSGCPIRYAPAPSTPRIGCPLALTQKPLRKSGFFVCAISPSLATRIREEPGPAGIVHKPEGLGIADRSLAVNWNCGLALRAMRHHNLPHSGLMWP